MVLFYLIVPLSKETGDKSEILRCHSCIASCSTGQSSHLTLTVSFLFICMMDRSEPYGADKFVRARAVECQAHPSDATHGCISRSEKSLKGEGRGKKRCLPFSTAGPDHQVQNHCTVGITSLSFKSVVTFPPRPTPCRKPAF